MMTEDTREMHIRLAPIYPNPSAQIRPSADSGAGANASSRIDMAVVASDPLSELVWSPHKGLSTKCADCSFTGTKNSCPGVVGPSDKALSPTHNIRSRGVSDDKHVRVRSTTVSETQYRVTTEAVENECSAKSPRSSTSPVIGSSEAHQSGHESRRTTDFRLLLTNESKCEMISEEVIREDMTNSIGRNDEVSRVNQMLDLEIGLAAKDHFKNKRGVLDGPMSRSLLLRRTLDDSKRSEIDGQNPKNAHVESLERSAENDVPNIISENIYRISDEKTQMDKDSPFEASRTPSGSRSRMVHRKGKEKALFDSDIVERIEKDEDESHYSVESCNSARLLPRGKRQCGFDQQLVGGTKRIKNQIQEDPTATSLVKQDSSFMNWISNMVKGLAKVNQDECTLAFTLDHPSHKLEGYDQRNATCTKTYDSGGGNMGFQSIFQSLYCSNTSLRETKLSKVHYPVSGTNELVEAGKTCISVMPISFCRENDKSCQKFRAESNNNFNHDASGNGGSSQPSFPPLNPSVDVHSAQETCRSLSSENKNSKSQAFFKDKNVSSSSSLPDKQKSASPEDNSLHSQEALRNIGNENVPVRSLWITRFSSKTHWPVSNLDHRGSTCVMREHNAGSTKPVPRDIIDSISLQKDSDARESSADPSSVAGKNTRNDATNAEDSMGFKRVLGHNYEQPLCRSSPLVLKSSEAMASLFAKRLEALKSIIPADDVTQLTKTCSFCGKSGHNICNCSEVNRAELEDLLRGIDSRDVTEGAPCLCIRCSQLGHWAIACPVASLSRQRQSSNDASLKGKLGSDRRESCLREVQNHVSSSYKETQLEEIQVTPLLGSASKLVSGAPNVLAAVRRLRLSRIDILRWMKSNRPLSCLDGFFLRVRLAKWEKGVAGSGYYVASVNEMQRENISDVSHNSMYVLVGGVKCLVESRYVSNHDFSEDELMAWWHTISKSGEVPTEDELKSKFEERQKLGV